MKLIIIGIGETARIALEYFKHDSNYEVVAFLADSKYIHTKEIYGLPIFALENISEHFSKDDYSCFIAAGSSSLNRDRQKLYEYIKDKGYKCANYISSKAFIWHDVKIGENCLILENNVLQSGVSIGNNVTLWSGNHIGHNTTIKDHVFISSHCVISGECIVNNNCFIGVNTAIADNIAIAQDCFLGMGVVINKNTENNSVYIVKNSEKSVISATRLCKVKG